MRKFIAAIVLCLILAPTAHAVDQPLTVASRNIYLGADVGVALELIPDFPAAAQFMWEQVATTDFTQRAPGLAKEIIESGADVVGIQEATHWYCKKNLWSKKVVVFDFLKEFLAATKTAGSEYVLASKNGVDALNIGYSIPAIPYLTMVTDPKTFQPLFGSDKAACGFEIGDAIVVKKELKSQILAVGNSEYETSYSIVPQLMTIYRGYTWIDLRHQGSNVRIISTHLESLWDSNKVPNAALQAKQLINDLSITTMPVIVLGDFNSDPRDPRPDAKSNPGGQPEASETCNAQVKFPTPITAIESCNAYWLMRKAGFADAGPDSLNSKHFTWGMSALLTGPDPKRLKAAQEMGNIAGFTDRLDYIFVKNGANVISSSIIGNIQPANSRWNTDHAGVVAMVSLPVNKDVSPALDSHAPFPISFWNWVGIATFASILTLMIYRRKRKRE
jgi:endonuclease/exonuclease/phosphatase family metal-dependent hydrolase